MHECKQQPAQGGQPNLKGVEGYVCTMVMVVLPLLQLLLPKDFRSERGGRVPLGLVLCGKRVVLILCTIQQC